jgi:hypothetical protein
MIRFVRDIHAVLQAPCCEHSALLSRELDEPLRAGQRAGLWLHLRVCRACRTFRAHLRRIAELHASEPGPHVDAAMPDHVRARIVGAVRRESGHDH